MLCDDRYVCVYELSGKGKTLSKLQFSIVASAALLHLLKRQLDAACLALFDEEVYYRSACRSASTHYKILIEQLQKCLQAPPSKATNATAALHSIAEQMHRRSLVVIFSDMVDGSTDTDELFAALQHLKYNKHEVILFHVMDGEQEVDFNFENRPYEFIDMETGDKIKLLTQQLKEEYSKQVSAFHASIRQKCLQYHIDFIPVNLRQPVEEVLRSFLLKRQRMGGNG